MQNPINCGRAEIRALLSGLGRFLLVILCLSSFVPLATHAAEPDLSSLDQGYRLMYNLQFSDAQKRFAEWQHQYPSEALGPVSQAANLLFSEFARLGILESEFFVKNSWFESRQKLSPDEHLREQFDADLTAAEQQARKRLTAVPRDPDALFVLAMVFGLRADYEAMVEKRNMVSLSDTREASSWADKALAEDPSYYDAYLATGIAKYIVGSVVAPVRWILKLDGYSADKKQGVREMQVAAQKGRLLGPFARILLAVAALRDGHPAQAKSLLIALRDEFPSNPLFPREIARLDDSDRTRPR